jgi:microcystin-dependent protein
MAEQNMLIPKSIDSGENGSSVFKPGHIIAYLGQIQQTVSGGVVTTTAPQGWLLCNGNIISKTEYANLWNAVKHSNDTYPYGSTSTTFTLPNLISSFLSIGSSGAYGGSNSHTHGSNVFVNGVTNTVQVNHQHNQSNGYAATNDAHTHGDGGGYIGPNGSGSTADANKTGSGGAGVGPGAGHIHDATANVGPLASSFPHTHGVGVSSGAVSENHSHNFQRVGGAVAASNSNAYPTYKVNFIIKV